MIELFTRLHHPPRRHVLAATVIVGTTIFFALTLRTGHDWGGDFSLYIQHAENIAHGRPYGESLYVVDPEVAGRVPPSSYPPIFPLLLAPTVLLSGEVDLWLMKLELVLLYGLLLGAVYATMGRYNAGGYGVPIVLLMGLNPYFWEFKDQILSDIPFALFVYIFLILASFVYREAEPGRRPFALAAVAGLVIYLATGTRTLGITLIPAVIAYEILRFRRLPYLALTSTSVALLCLSIQRLILGATSTYSELFRLRPELILRNAYSYPGAFRDLILDVYSEPVVIALVLTANCFVLYGFITRLKSRVTLLEVVPVVYLGPLFVWPYYQGLRFLIPLIPLFFLYLLVGVHRFSGRLSRRSSTVLQVALACALLLTYGKAYGRMDYGHVGDGIATPHAVDLFEHVQTYDGSRELFIFNRPRVLAVFAGVRSADYFQAEDPGELWEYFERVGATRIIVSEADAYLSELVDSNVAAFDLVYDNGHYRVYRIQR